MNFRSKVTMAAAMAILMLGVLGWQAEPEEIDYADRSLPEIPVPQFEGERYETKIPDTLDLVDRAKLAIRAITEMLDPSRDYLMFTHAWFNRNPPIITINLEEEIFSCGGKHLESLPLLRILSGSTFNIEVDQKFMQSMLRMTAKDGSMYISKSKRTVNPRLPPAFPEAYASVEGEGRHMLAMAMWYQHDKNPLWKTLIEKKVKRLTEIAIQEDDYAYFNNRPYQSPGYKEHYFTAKDTGPIRDPSGGKGGFENAKWPHRINWLLSRSLCVAYRVTGHKPALELAGKIIRGVREHRKGFDEEGRWLLYHFHTSSASLLAMLEYAIITRDRELLELVREGYEYGKVVGDSVLGFFPEYVPGSEQYLKRSVNTCETCEVTDMIGLGLKLTQAGVGDYWEDVDRWVRNQFVENQLTSVDWVENVQPEGFKLFPRGDFGDTPVESWESTDVQRAVGSFAGWSLPNDWGFVSAHMCCTGNAGRTLYWIWDSILTRKDGMVKINLLLNRASPWLDVDSYLPYEGKVVVKIKKANEVAIRIPEWTDRDKVSCQVNGKRQEFSWSGNYVEVRGLERGNSVTVEFPMREKTLFRVISRFPYKLTIKGNTVIDIDPKGKINPIYRRDHYRQNQAPTKKVTRFVSNEALIW